MARLRLSDGLSFFMSGLLGSYPMRRSVAIRPNSAMGRRTDLMTEAYCGDPTT